MEIVGLTLQAFAGIVYGLSYVIDESRFKIPNRILHWLFSWPTARERRPLKIAIICALLVPAAFYISTVLLERYQGHNMLPWYEILVGAIFITGLAGLFYLQSFIELPRITKRSSKLTSFLRGDLDKAAFRKNLLLLPMFVVLSIASFFLFISFATRYNSIGELNALSILYICLTVPFMILYALSSISLIMSLVYLVASLYLKILERMAKVKKGPVWSVVLQLFVIGSALLIASVVIH